jgi:hypothetical protein
MQMIHRLPAVFACIHDDPVSLAKVFLPRNFSGCPQ